MKSNAANKGKKRKRGRPAEGYSQVARVLALYERLRRHDVVNAVELAQDLNFSKRTIERDLCVLKELRDVRLEKVKEPKAGWRIPEPHRRWTTTRWQVLAVALGARMSGFLSGRQFDVQVRPLLEELRGSLPAGRRLDLHGLEQKLHVIENGQKLYRENPESQRTLDEMIDALLLDQPTSLVYHSPPRSDRTSRQSTFLVHALCMTVYRGGVYFVVDVLGGDRHVGRRLLLALDRMTNVAVDRNAEVRHMPIDFSAHEFFETAFGIFSGDEAQLHDVRIVVQRELAHAVRERTWHASQVLAERNDGALMVEMELGHLQEVTEWILGMGEYVKVEGPPELVEIVKRRHHLALAQYANNCPATYPDASSAQASLRGQTTARRSSGHE